MTLEDHTTDQLLEELYLRLLPKNQESLQISIIMGAVASAFGITVEEMVGHSKLPEFSHPRTCSMSLCYSLSQWNQVEIATEHKRDPSTVASSRVRIKELLRLPEVVRAMREALRVINKEKADRRKEVPA